MVFLFILHIRFPKGKSIAEMIRSRYGITFVRKIRKYEKNDYKLRKDHLDLRFLLEFKKNNWHLHNSVVYKKRRIKLLVEEIRAMRIRINNLGKDTKRIKEESEETLSCLDFSYISFFFLVVNDKSILHHDNIQKQKLKNPLEISL